MILHRFLIEFDWKKSDQIIGWPFIMYKLIESAQQILSIVHSSRANRCKRSKTGDRFHINSNQFKCSANTRTQQQEEQAMERLH